MSQNPPKQPPVTLQPHVSTDQSGRPTGAGMSGTFQDGRNTFNGGFFTTPNSMTVTGGANRQLTPSTNVGIQGQGTMGRGGQQSFSGSFSFGVSF